MFKLTALVSIVFSFHIFADVTIKDAPMEWLVVETLQHKYNEPFIGQIQDDLLKEISQNIEYDIARDELIFKTQKNLADLREKLIDFLETKYKKTQIDEKFISWASEKNSNIAIKLEGTSEKVNGFYYFNHIHTNISQDNSSLKWLKHSPHETYQMLKSFLSRRRARGAVALTDHDSDKAHNDIQSILDSKLHSLRGVEWGGATHMCLVGIKENWDNLSHGREYEGEESVKESRSSEGFRIVNHPNRKNPAFPQLSWLDADGVEVWNTILENSPFFYKRSNNRDALNQWTDSLRRGQTYTAVAGSDFHFSIPCLQEKTLVYPVNFIPGEDQAKTKDYLFDGRTSFITRSEAPKLTLRARKSGSASWTLMGGKLPDAKKVDIELLADFSDTRARLGGFCYNTVRRFYRLFTFWKKEIWEVRFYNLKNEVVAKEIINPKLYNAKKHLKASFSLNIEDSTDIVRAELWAVNKKQKQIDLLGATNPIYINW